MNRLIGGLSTVLRRGDHGIITLERCLEAKWRFRNHAICDKATGIFFFLLFLPSFSPPPPPSFPLLSVMRALLVLPLIQAVEARFVLQLRISGREHTTTREGAVAIGALGAWLWGHVTDALPDGSDQVLRVLGGELPGCL